MPKPRRRPPAFQPDSRARLLDAAAAEFAARGFDGAIVDRIARRARLNKAMIYYHFASKQALYREILRDMYDAVGARLRATVAAPIDPGEKLRQFLAALVDEAQKRPHFPSMMLREIAEGGPHLDRETLRMLAGLFLSVRAIVEEGQRTGAFAPAHPLLVHFSLIGPMVIFLVSAPVRAALRKHGLAQVPDIDAAAFADALQQLVRRGLACA